VLTNLECRLERLGLLTTLFSSKNRIYICCTLLVLCIRLLRHRTGKTFEDFLHNTNNVQRNYTRFLPENSAVNKFSQRVHCMFSFSEMSLYFLHLYKLCAIFYPFKYDLITKCMATDEIFCAFYSFTCLC